MLFARNFPIGKSHLTENGIKSLCGVPFKNPDTQTFKAEIINDITTCHECLKKYEPKKWVQFFKQQQIDEQNEKEKQEIERKQEMERKQEVL